MARDDTPAVAHASKPSVADTLCAALVGNLFGNAVVLLAVLAWAASHASTPVRLAIATALLGYAATVCTSRGHLTGSATWPAFRSSALWRGLLRYHDMRLVGKPALVRGQNYIFCVAPHGIHGFGLSLFA